MLGPRFDPEFGLLSVWSITYSNHVHMGFSGFLPLLKNNASRSICNFKLFLEVNECASAV